MITTHRHAARSPLVQSLMLAVTAFGTTVLLLATRGGTILV